MTAPTIDVERIAALWRDAGLPGVPDLQAGDALIVEHLQPAMARVLGVPATVRSAAVHAALGRLVGLLVLARLVPVLEGEHPSWRTIAYPERPIDRRLFGGARVGSVLAPIDAPPGVVTDANIAEHPGLRIGDDAPQRTRQAVNQRDGFNALPYPGEREGATVTIAPKTWTRIGVDQPGLSDVQRLDIIREDRTRRGPGLYIASEILEHRRQHFADVERDRWAALNHGQFHAGYLAGLAAANH